MKISTPEIKKSALKTIDLEAQAIAGLAGFIDDDFAACIHLIYNSKGRVIVTGIGKSAIIGEKIVATFNSTGTPAIFMHAADAVHGDLGIVQKDDVIICISKSGATPEIQVLIPYLKLSGNKIIALAGNRDSYLAHQADYLIETTVSQEACPNNLAPTSSTTAQLVMGDAMAVALLELRGFSSEDFALYHPGGALGKKLFLKVADLYINNEKPMVNFDTDIPDAIVEISSKRLGTTAVLKNGKLVGVITDGDLRRMIQSGKPFHTLKAEEVMTKNPLTVSSGILVAKALDIMRSNNITQLPVVDGDEYLGVIHLHDILKEGIL
ncbi:MAG: KpsF/GutQ family sugar-phosphate isomerase [Bacteroidales bacterium]|nr:KpsF/GutQ family sugar-phosphate isomerase [Bacteroidales bacterium]